MSRGTDDLVLCTINTGELYSLHITLAKSGTELDGWVNYVKRVALPNYQREQREPYFGLYQSEIETVAQELKDYSENCIKEGA